MQRIQTGYALFPIILLEAHSAFENKAFVVRNLEEWKKHGYKVVCYETDAKFTLDEQIEYYHSILEKSAPNLASIPQVQIQALRGALVLLEAVKKAGLDYQGFDVSEEELKKNEALATDENSDYYKARNEFIATSIQQAAQKYNGGIIVIMGLGHYSIQNNIQKLDTNAKQYTFLHLYDDGKLVSSQRDFLVRFAQPGAMEINFPLGMFFCNVKNQAKLDMLAVELKNRTGISLKMSNSVVNAIVASNSQIHTQNPLQPFNTELEKFMQTAVDRTYYASFEKLIADKSYNKALRMVCNDKKPNAVELAAILFKYKDILKLDVNEKPESGKSALDRAKENPVHAEALLKLFEVSTPTPKPK